MTMYKNAQLDGANYVKAVGESSAGVPDGPNIIALPEDAPIELLSGTLYEAGVFKDGPGGAVIYDPTP